MTAPDIDVICGPCADGDHHFHVRDACSLVQCKCGTLTLDVRFAQPGLDLTGGVA